jgi:hypothetical protein
LPWSKEELIDRAFWKKLGGSWDGLLKECALEHGLAASVDAGKASGILNALRKHGKRHVGLKRKQPWQ